MRLYHFSHSSSSWRVRIALALKGIDFESVSINVRRGVDGQAAEHFASLNPMRQIPVLEWEDNGVLRVLSQSMAILRYLEASVPEPALWPTDPYEQAQATQLAEIVNAGIQPLQNNRVLGRLSSLGVDSQAWAHDEILKGLQSLEETAAAGPHGPFLLGSAPTVADLYAVPQLYNARRFDIDVARFPVLHRSETHCLELKAFGDTHPDADPGVVTPTTP